MWGRFRPRAVAGMAVLCLCSFLEAANLPSHVAVQAFPELTFIQPLFVTFPPDGSDRLFIIEQNGRVLWIENRPDEIRTDVALDITSKVRRQHMEEGLLGLAFHPNAKSNKKIYLHYSASNPRRNVLSEWKMNGALTKILPNSERVLLEVEQPFGNHNGGMIAFGPDKMLYVALGDGGGVGDPYSKAQNKQTCLGKILRIDVDKTDGTRAYAIPPDNPFVNEKDTYPEIWAYGFRNPWRFSFDRETGLLWAGDVGQNAWEEVDTIEKGFNYGWNVREGKHPYVDLLISPIPEGPFREPVWDYGRTEGQSITGGYVYRGQKLPELVGAYIYGDFMSGKIWALRDAKSGNPSNTLIAKGTHISSFGEDKNGEIYFTSLYDGKIYTLKKR
jgi:glucose/arabinose dehydrogenase